MWKSEMHCFLFFYHTTVQVGQSDFLGNLHVLKFNTVNYLNSLSDKILRHLCMTCF